MPEENQPLMDTESYAILATGEVIPDERAETLADMLDESSWDTDPYTSDSQ